MERFKERRKGEIKGGIMEEDNEKGPARSH